MKYAKPLLIALLLFLPSLLLPPFLVPLVLPFAHWVNESGRPGMDPDGWLPWWARWLDTPDQMLPGDLTLPTVQAIYQRFGRFMCSWYWLGWRNQAQGLAAVFGMPVAMPWSPVPGYYEDRSTGLWWLRKPIFGGRLQLKAGWRTYRDGRGGWAAVPCLTITKA